MKKSFLLLVVLVAAVVFAGCQAPEGDNNLELKTINAGSTGENQGSVVPQVGIPADEDDFANPLTEQAQKSGLTADDVQQVREKLAESFKMDLAEVQITAEAESSLEFMTGFVNVGEGDKGGIYFAAKTADGWQIAHNGVGLIYCEIVDKYNFPVGMIPKCYDAVTGTSKERE
ncbi:MAG: hypothetical protein ACOZAK_03425 [Patescibacteria group bacterium]